MSDPYMVLGVSRDATDDEVKKAYRELARKYHPDNYQNNPLADLVEEKMKEINEAYDTIQKMRAAGRNGNSGGNYNSGDDSGTRGGEFARVRQLINNNELAEADNILNMISESDRNAEWNFLRGCVLTKRGWYFDAQKCFETACYMDPNNAEYRSALNGIRNSADAFGRGYRTDTSRGSCSACDVCSSLICADCLCECCGGDLINCC